MSNGVYWWLCPVQPGCSVPFLISNRLGVLIYKNWNGHQSWLWTYRYPVIEGIHLEISNISHIKRWLMKEAGNKFWVTKEDWEEICIFQQKKINPKTVAVRGAWMFTLENASRFAWYRSFPVLNLAPVTVLPERKLRFNFCVCQSWSVSATWKNSSNNRNLRTNGIRGSEREETNVELSIRYHCWIKALNYLPLLSA